MKRANTARVDTSNPDLQPEGTNEAPEAEAPGALEVLQRAEIDQSVSTAKRYPRSIKQFLVDAESMISMDTDTAESCNYKLKRKNADGSVKIIEGPSIRLMEIVASSWGNLRYGSRTISTEGSFATCQGVAHDLQRNVNCTVEIQRRITNKEGRRYSEDMIGVTANAGGSIARRNALKGVIPVAYVNRLLDFSKKVALGDAKTLPERRQRALEYFTKTLGIDLSRVLAYLEKPTVEDLTLADVEDLQGLKTAIKEADITIEEAFADTAKVKGPAPSNKTDPPTTYPAGTGQAPEKPKDKPKTPEEQLAELNGLMGKENITESQMVGYLHKLKACDDSLTSLIDISKMAPAAIANAITGFKVIKQQLKGGE